MWEHLTPNALLSGPKDTLFSRGNTLTESRGNKLRISPKLVFGHTVHGNLHPYLCNYHQDYIHRASGFSNEEKKKKQFYFYIKPHLIKCRGLEKYYSSKITTKTTNCFYMYKNNKFRMVVTSGKRGRGLWRKTQRALTETVL